jgi:hypothetical protein
VLKVPPPSSGIFLKGSAMERTYTQKSIHLTRRMLDFIQREAEREERTVAGQIRHLVVEAMRRAEQPAADHGEPRR